MHIIGGKFKKAKLVSPKGTQTRPTKNILRETFFNIVAPYLQDAIFLDIFAGSGAMGLEAISRGCKHCYFIENHKNALIAIEKNIQLLKVQSQCSVLKGDALNMLSQVTSLCDIIFADPPYAKPTQQPYSEVILKFLKGHVLLKEQGKIFLEVGRDEEIAIEDFDYLSHVRSKVIGNSKLIELKLTANP